MKVLTIFSLLIFFLFSCVQKDEKSNEPVKTEIKNKDKVTPKGDTTSFGDSKENLKSFEQGKVVTSKTLPSGIQIKWLNDAEGRKIKDGEMVLIEYRLTLPDGKIIDGNNRANLPVFPFIVGYNVQTLGWDIAFKELSLGDFVKIELPSSFAYGNKGLGDVIPANSTVWLYVKIYSYVEPSINENGIKSWLIKDGIASDLDQTEDKQFYLQMTASTKTTANVINTYFNNTPIRYIPGQNALVPGLRKILKKAKVGERYFVLLEAAQAYGKFGFANKVKPNEAVLFNVEIDDVRAI